MPQPTDWPCCPQCQRPRQTKCPVCNTAGHKFNWSDDDSGEPAVWSTDQDAAPLLLCSTCDDAFAPQFLRHCEWCRHDFGNGTQLAPPRELRPIEANTWAIIVVAAAIVWMAGHLLSYW